MRTFIIAALISVMSGSLVGAQTQAVAPPTQWALNAQSQPPQTAPLRFEVASLKPRGDAFIDKFGFQISPGRIINRCAR
jgi:hypothetical protein